jgi:hypothetical protein
MQRKRKLRETDPECKPEIETKVSYCRGHSEPRFDKLSAHQIKEESQDRFT